MTGLGSKGEQHGLQKILNIHLPFPGIDRNFKRKMENRGLLFIPDISGFTRFVTETEIEHSRLIIQELLELLINTNKIGLEISEIEGDAILFYRFGEAPDLKELYHQVADMFCAFHRHLSAYDQRRYCYCRACTAASDLTLKIITHYGEFTTYSVKNFHKLIGKDVIVAHQLLKNNIEQHEYWLVTRPLLQDSPPPNLARWIEWRDSSKPTDTGVVSFQYTQLSPLKATLPPEPPLLLELPNKTRVFSLCREYDTDILTLFHAVGDFNYRSRWLEGVKEVQEVAHFLPRVGMRCRCIMENGETTIYSSSYTYHNDRIQFSETDDAKKSAAYYLLEETGPRKTKLTLEYYLRKNLVAQLLFGLTKKKAMVSTFEKSLDNLEALAKEIHLPAQAIS